MSTVVKNNEGDLIMLLKYLSYLSADGCFAKIFR